MTQNPPQETRSTAAARIMVVEDEGIVALDIQSKLEKLGYQVPALVDSGEEAVEAAAEVRPDLILMDIQLSGQMDGVEAARQIRERLSIPVIFLTAFSGEAIVQRAQTTEPFGYVLKPFQTRELHTTIEIGLYRHRTEVSLRRLERALMQSMDGIAVTDMEGNLQFVNQAWAQMHGGEAAKMAARNVALFYTDEQFAGEMVPFIERIEEKGREQGEINHARKDGTTFPTWMSGTLVRDGEGGELGFVHIARDITEAKRREIQQQTLQRVREEVWKMESPRDIEKILVHIRDGLEALKISFERCAINIVDSSGDLPTVRSHSMIEEGEWAELSAGGREVILEIWRAGVPAYRRDLETVDTYGEREPLSRALGAPVRSVLDVPFAQGTLAISSIEAGVFSSEDVELVQELALVLDEGFQRREDIRRLEERNRALEREITERQLAEETKTKLEEQLRHAQKMEAIGELAAGIAHNLNNMLGGIMGNVELAMIEPPDERQDYLEDAVRCSQEASDMIKQLMIFSRKADIDRRTIDVGPIAEQVTKICRTMFDRKIEIALDKPAFPLPTLGDSGQLYQVFLNLCINARDAIETLDEDGQLPRITLQASCVYLSAEDGIRHPQAEPGGYVRVAVQDSGQGMDVDTQKRIFDPFFTTKDIGKGTGLGLAIVYGVVQQHSGWIEVASEPGVGSTFSVYLPMVEEETTDAEGEEDEETAGGNENILIIDDDRNVRNVIYAFLSHYGYTVSVGEDGKDGLEKFRMIRKQVDLVILDLSMPKMSGREVLKEIKALEPECKVIVLTGAPADYTKLEGAIEVIFKPLQMKKIVQTVRAALDS